MNSLFIGRFQPFHKGHRAIVDKLLDEGKDVVVAIRDTKLSSENPLSAKDRKKRIRKHYGNKVKTIIIPDINELNYGRKVGYKIRRVRLDRHTEAVSASGIRSAKKKLLWLTGNVSSGKTSLAFLLKERLGAVVLDGDEMRGSISLGAGFSKADREEHNLRVARLAKVFLTHGDNVVVSVIAPFQSARNKIEKIIKPNWVYIKGGKTGKSMPYEPPKRPFITIDPSKEKITDSLERIVRKTLF